eukprot:9503885-Pyramimonas_sp.AAC.1
MKGVGVNDVAMTGVAERGEQDFEIFGDSDHGGAASRRADGRRLLGAIAMPMLSLAVLALTPFRRPSLAGSRSVFLRVGVVTVAETGGRIGTVRRRPIAFGGDECASAGEFEAALSVASFHVAQDVADRVDGGLQISDALVDGDVDVQESGGMFAESASGGGQLLCHDALADALCRRRFVDAACFRLVEHELEGGAHGGRGGVGFGVELMKKMAAAAIAGEGVGLTRSHAIDRAEDGFEKSAVVGRDELRGDHEAVLEIRSTEGVVVLVAEGAGRPREVRRGDGASME